MRRRLHGRRAWRAWRQGTALFAGLCTMGGDRSVKIQRTIEKVLPDERTDELKKCIFDNLINTHRQINEFSTQNKRSGFPSGYRCLKELS